MNGVIGFTDLLLRGDLTPGQRQQVQLIAESGKAMTLLLNDILDLSKIEAGELTIGSEPVALHHIARHAVRVVEPTAREKNLSLDLRIDDDVPEAIMADGLRLRQVLLNLLGNAVKFTGRGMVSLAVRRIGAELEFTVRDTGIGIPADRIESIFGDFVQIGTTASGQRGGTGLGLAISARLAALMGGTLTADSIVDAGSCFVLRVPLNVVDTSGAAKAYGAQAGQATEPASRPAVELPLEGNGSGLRAGRILLAEDYDINQMLIAAMAEEAGVPLVIAGNGLEAVRMVEEAAASGEPFAMVLMDMQMPEMDGIAAARELRKRGFSATDLPIVALTANAYPEDIEDCLAAGMQAHCSKPLSMEQFEQILRRWLSPDGGPGLSVAA
jgi:CheY-like chemotaxis protein